MARVRIEDRDGLIEWLNGLPEKDGLRRRAAVAIAARAAMRALPALEIRLKGDEGRAMSIILPTFYALAASRLAAAGTSRYAEVRKTARAADTIFTNAVFGTDFEVDFAAATTFTTFAARATARAASTLAARATVADAVRAVAAAADAAANGFKVAANAADDAAFAARVATWKVVEADADAIANGISIPDLMNTPLWPDGTPDWAQKLWRSMKARLLAREGEHWDVWTNWYDARLDPSRPIPCYNPPDENLERARVLLPESLWEKGPAAVNEEIRRLIDESGCAERPEPPEPVEGPLFRLEEDGRLEQIVQPPSEEEAADAVQQQMFSRLRQKLAQLAGYGDVLGNQHPELYALVRDYEQELDVTSLGELDVPALWMAGQGLIAQAEAFRNRDEDALTPALEPGVEGLLNEIAGLHGGFIMGFETGRKLTERAARARANPRELERLAEPQRRLLSAWFSMGAEWIGERARRTIQAASDIYLQAGISMDEKAGMTMPVVHNVLSALGKFTFSLPVAFFTGALATRFDGVSAWVNFLREHSASILTFAESTPEMRAYFRYLYDRFAPDGENDLPPDAS